MERRKRKFYFFGFKISPFNDGYGSYLSSASSLGSNSCSVLVFSIGKTCFLVCFSRIMESSEELAVPDDSGGRICVWWSVVLRN